MFRRSSPTPTGKLSDARESLNKAQLRRQLVELRADRDATVLTVAKVSVGSVLQSGQQFITLVPADAPLEVEANIAGRDDGFVHVGDPVAIKFDTFPFIQYGMAYGTVRTSAPTASRRRTSSGTRPARCRCPSNSTEPFYRARITIDRVDLHGTPAGFALMPGMPVTADIKVGKRTVLAIPAGPGAAGRPRGDARAVRRLPAAVATGRLRPDRWRLLDRLLAALSPAAALRRAVRLTEQGDGKQAFPLLTRAARAGIAEAEYRVGRCYLEGAGVPPSRTEGARWLERAANQGYVEAQAQLATLAIHGLTATRGRQRDPAASLFATNDGDGSRISKPACSWARQAADGGSADGQAVLGYILTSGPETMRDLGRGASLVRAFGRGRLPAGRPRLCAVAGAQRRRPRSSRRRSRSTCAARRMPACRPRSICSA